MGSVKGFKGRPAGFTTGRPSDDLQQSAERLQHSFQQDGPGPSGGLTRASLLRSCPTRLSAG
ncbi:hypothetical protein ABBQ38_009148 [Trebouxia sp. C0009 RCD-2024]